ncbi:hypothetical protein WJS89_12160 [Sphingomicrobium sp. XHP0235]|uniref:helix-turn-helix transcriptional regulator n=1 Tax=Sphingomicrobium aquimarinum TaxID=3133971 RepID=UPI0031FEC6BB
MTQKLRSLTQREYRLLKLLAGGHTIKSAIAETGDTEFAAQEVLRSARKKLGVSSSREAARLIAADSEASQKNCTTISGIESAGPPSPSRRWKYMGGLLMIAALIFTALQLQPAVPGAGAGPVAASGPKVVSTLPAQDAEIEAGPFILRVTFDRPMIGRLHSVYSPATDSSPVRCEGPPELSQDRLSFSQFCIAQDGEEHVVWFGHEDFGEFRSEDGQSASPYRLDFSVK